MAAQAAGTIRPTPKPYSKDPNAPVRKSLDPKKLTPAMKLVEEYAVLIAKHVVGADIKVAWRLRPVDASRRAETGPLSRAGFTP